MGLFSKTSNSNEKTIGFPDEAATKDLLGIEKYVSGLARFIEECNTPLTISIQGSWGTGKTSIMRFVENELSKENVYPVYFNTWQFSQFNMSEQLPISLVSGLLSKFNIKDENTLLSMNTIISGLHSLYSLTKFASLTSLSFLAPSAVAESAASACKVVEGTAEKFTKNAKEYPDPAKYIVELKDKFKDCVQKTLSEHGKKRIAIFIDDLDRLNPGKAVELLEILKLFLDCKDCVYILAIDYDVVCRGVEAKYGSFSDDSNLSAEKGKSFFDKIIQVPFKVPIAKYNIFQYVEKCFNQIGIEFNETDEVKEYVGLIQYSIGRNPRSMKRLFNAFQLLLKVVPEATLKEAQNKQLLFAILCLQHCHYSEKIYNFAIGNITSLTKEIFNELLNANYSGFVKLLEDRHIDSDITEDDFEASRPFLEKLKNVLDVGVRDNYIDDEEFEHFKDIMDWTSITNTVEDENKHSLKRGSVIVPLEDLEMAGNNKEDIDHICNVIKQIGSGIDVEAVRRNRKGDMIRGRLTGKTFLEVNDRQDGYAMELYLPDKKMLDDAILIKFAEDLGGTIYYNYKSIVKRIIRGGSLQVEEKRLIELGKKIYSLWENKIK